MVAQAGLEFSQNVIYELKWKPKDDAVSSDEEPKKKDEDKEKEEKPEKPTPEEISTLRALLCDFETEEKEWLTKMFVEKRDIVLRWTLN